MTFARLLSEVLASEGLPRTGDVLTVGLPLLREIDALHHLGLVSPMRTVADIDFDGHHLRLVHRGGKEAESNDVAIRRLNPATTAAGIEVRSRNALDHVVGQSATMTSRDVHLDTTAPDRAVFMSGYRAWEQSYGHHDPVTDVHVCGLILVSYAAGLDLDNEADLHTLALHRLHLGRLNPHLHPVVVNVLAEMIDPDRHGRPAEMSQVLARLEHHRELPDDLDLSVAYDGRTPWQQGVLSTLRNRVFDTSRRNRALYFKPSATTVSLTEASVPLLLNVERISPDDLFTWTADVADRLRSGKTIDIEQWCRLEEAPHLAPALDKLISSERKLRNESGHGRLRLIVAFLRWFDPEAKEIVHSPFLTLPVELTKRKGVRKRYSLALSGEAAVNPILRFVFKNRFDITLPEFVDPDVASIKQLAAELERQVRATDPGIGIDVIEKPRIDLLRRRAQLRVDNFRRRRARTQAVTGRWRRTNHSYVADDWRPLGLALYNRFVAPDELPLRQVAGAAPRVRRRPQSFTDGAAAGQGAERANESFSIAAGDVDAQRWEVDLCSVTLAMLGTRRTSLSRDYDELLSRAGADDTFAGTPFDELFSPTSHRGQLDGVAPISIDQHLVLPADDAQAKAVRQAVRGDSFIIQGPPGTGKSQTITNVIAALVAEGKRVLFVCEKRAALDVVGHRLRQVGLGDLVATIHDSQLDRKSFVVSLGETYEAWLGAQDAPNFDRSVVLSDVEAALRPLDVLVAEFGRSRYANQSVRQLVERSVLLRSSGVEPAKPGTTSLPEWFQARPGLDAVADALTESGLTAFFGQHRCLFVKPAAASTSDPVAMAISTGRQVRDAAEHLVRQLSPMGGVDAVTVREARDVAEFAAVLSAAGASQNPSALDPSHPAHLDLRAALQTLNQQQRAVAESMALTHWTAPLDPADARNALAIAQKSEASFLKFLRGDWRRVKNLVEASYDFSVHQVPPAISSVLTELVQHHELQSLVQQTERGSTERFGSSDVGSLVAVADRHHTNPIFRHLMKSDVAASGKVEAVAQAAATLVQAADGLLLGEDVALEELMQLARGLVGTSVAHERALVRWADLQSVNPDLLRWVLASEASVASLELGLVDQALRQTLAETSGSLRSGAEVDVLVTDVLAKYKTLLDANAANAREVVKARFLQRVAHSEASMAGRSDEDKTLKKQYSSGRRVLEREFAKKMRYRSIRELASEDSGLVVRDLRPIWLMSPLSVSDTLPLDGSMFDAVVFDEASQIPVEDAVPSIFRSNQVIVVGDRMQLPPTRFFSTSDDDEEGIEVVDDGTRITLSLDADSFLTQADQALASSMLTWHYRSRSEALIAYSNSAFYGGELATIPDRVSDDVKHAALVIETADDARVNATALLERPISFHYLDGGIYQNRSNDDEADYIAELVRELLRRETGLTIGIVAFSEAQQNTIETSLGELGALDAEFAESLEAERNRVEGDEFMGLFVKNLENVQGDERDVIIMSVCYGPGEDGRVRMNFGPINQPGGERRLNVIFSRSKQHMAIVSSMLGREITNTHNDGAAHLANFLTYAAAESMGADDLSQAILETQHGDRAATPAARSAIAQEIAERLRIVGWEVDLDVGRSVFRLDAAVKVADRYIMGVLIEPAETGSAASRFVAEAGVLDAFGWHTLRLTPTEWWASPDRVVERIDHELRLLLGED